MMKFVTVMVAAAGLAACRQTPQESAIDNNASMIEDSLARQADNMEAIANDAADRNAAQAIRNAADQLDAARDNVADAADAAKDNVQR